MGRNDPQRLLAVAWWAMAWIFYMCIHLYIFVYIFLICVHFFVCVYMRVYRNQMVSLCITLYIYIYIYILLERILFCNSNCMYHLVKWMYKTWTIIFIATKYLLWLYFKKSKFWSEWTCESYWSVKGLKNMQVFLFFIKVCDFYFH